MTEYNLKRTAKPVLEEIAIQSAEYPDYGQRTTITVHVTDQALDFVAVSLMKGNGNRNNLHVEPHELDNLVEALTMAQRWVQNNLEAKP